MTALPQSRERPVGVLGGTFDPIHNGHLRPAVELLERLGLAEVRLVPGAVPPHRGAPRVTARQRLELVRRAVSGVPGLAVDDRELRRSGPSYTVQTLISLREELGARPLCFAMGADAFAGLHRWHRWRELTDYAHIVVLHRPGQHPRLAPELASWLEPRRSDRAEAVPDAPAGSVLFLTVTSLDVSATRIRRLIAQGHSARFLVPETVWSTIGPQGWYGYPRL
jgi:nicotinate-nucleotide adenylyltransferase